MERSGLTDQLPDMLAVAVRLDDAGHPAETIGCALGVPVESVPNLLLVAHRKLEHLVGAEPGDTTGSGIDTV